MAWQRGKIGFMAAEERKKTFREKERAFVVRIRAFIVRS